MSVLDVIAVLVLAALAGVLLFAFAMSPAGAWVMHATASVRYFLAGDRDVPVMKVSEDGDVARFVRADGRVYRKYYDAYGGIGRTSPSILPWGKVFYRPEVAFLKHQRP